jgi:hypothetical protein
MGKLIRMRGTTGCRRPGHRYRYAALAVLGAAVGLAVAACSSQERVCSEGQYPVKYVGSATGSMCVADAEEPPAGYVRYPAGQVPEYRFDKWDKQWQNAVFDKDGNVVSR